MEAVEETEGGSGDWALASWALTEGLWDGREVSWDDVMDLQLKIRARIRDILRAEDGDLFRSQQMAAVLARLGATPETRPWVERDIQELRITPEGMIIPAGLGKSCKTFYRDHKQEIIIAIVVVAVVTAVVVVAVYSSGTATTGAGAAGGALLNNMINGAGEGPGQITAKAEELRLQELQRAEPAHQEAEEIRWGYKEDSQFAEWYEEAFNRVLHPIQGQELAWNKDGLVKAPFGKLEPLGDPYKQGTVHYHCGIANSREDVAHGGECLYNVLNQEFAVQPHQIHGPSLAKSLRLVFMEQSADLPIDTDFRERPPIPMGLKPIDASDRQRIAQSSKAQLEQSSVREAINYEKSLLASTAEEILATGNPKLKQLHVTFSNGGYVMREALKELTREQRDTIVLATLGTTAIIKGDQAHYVENIIGSKDWPSRVCNGGKSGIEKVQEEANVSSIPQTETNDLVKGHFFTQKEYQEAVKEFMTEVKKAGYEVY